MSNQLLAENKPKTFTMDNAPIETCERCNLEIRQGGHHNLFLCLYDLKREVEKAKKQNEILLDTILNGDFNQLSHLTRSINFQIHKIQSFIEATTTSQDFEKLHIFVIELVHTGKELQKLLQIN